MYANNLNEHYDGHHQTDYPKPYAIAAFGTKKKLPVFSHKEMIQQELH